MKHSPSLRQLRPALLIALLLGGGEMLCAQSTQSEWTGAIDNDWAKAGNWDGPPPASASDTALFTGSGINPVIGVATTIGGLEFQSGAGAYTLTGAALTIERGGQLPVHLAQRRKSANNLQ